jgi:hypothetical protein
MNHHGIIIQYLSICHPVDHKCKIGPQFATRLEDLKEIISRVELKERYPVAQVLGLSNLLDVSLISLGDLKEIIQLVKGPAGILDHYPRELSRFKTVYGSR